MRTATLAGMFLLCLAAVTYAADPLPVIPGAAGFGMDTPAGSGRHIAKAQETPVPEDAVAGHWTFDEGLPADGQPNGDVALIKRGEGQALKLTDKATLKLPRAEGYLKPGAGFAIMAWVCIDKVGGLVASNREKDGSTWQIGPTSGFGGKWRYFIAKPERMNQTVASKACISPGVWRHIAGVYGEDGTMTFYINGLPITSGRKEDVAGCTASRSSELVLGSGFSGQVDDVMLLSRALTAEEVMGFYARQHDAYFESRTEVYRVTNLNDSGPGSLRDGILTQERARTIVFEVSGTIELKDVLWLHTINSYLTIAGETAPSPGVTLKDYGIQLRTDCHDVLLKHLCIRTGDSTIFTQLYDGWTDVDGDGPGTVYSHPLAVTPQLAYGGGNKNSVWCFDKDLAHDPGKGAQVGLNKWDWDPGKGAKNPTRSPNGVLYINVGTDPTPGKVGVGAYKSSVCDPFTLDARVHDVVVDHVTTTWGGDMNMNLLGNYRVTVSNCISAEGLHNPRHPKGGHSRGILVSNYGDQAGHVCIVRNLFAFNMARNPTVTNVDDAMVANNLIVATNVGIRIQAGDGSGVGHNAVASVAIIGNVIERSNAPIQARTVGKHPETTESKIYFSPDNMVEGQTFESVADIWEKAVKNPFKAGAQPESCRVTTSPVTVPGLKLMPVTEVKEYVLANAGARPADRDPVDLRILDNVRNGKGKLPIASQDEVGGWVEIAENHRELTIPEDLDADDNGDGYTNLENWLHAFAAEVEGVKK